MIQNSLNIVKNYVIWYIFRWAKNRPKNVQHISKHFPKHFPNNFQKFPFSLSLGFSLSVHRSLGRSTPHTQPDVVARAQQPWGIDGWSGGSNPRDRTFVRDRTLGLEPSGSNPRARTHGIELARAWGGVMVRGGRSWLLSRVLYCTVHRLMTYDL